MAILQWFQSAVLPNATDFEKFSFQTRKELANVNEFELVASSDMEKLVSFILEGLSSLRLIQKLFISYKREKSSTVAIRLNVNKYELVKTVK